MPNAQPPYSTSPLLNEVDCIEHGFFGLQGGVSKGIYKSLNCGFSSADAQHKVLQNRRRVASCFGLKVDALYSLKQAHTCRVVTLQQNLASQFERFYEEISGKKVGNLRYFMILSSVHNLMRFYSGMNNPSITNETEDTMAFFKSVSEYPLFLVKLVKDECNIDLSQVKDYFTN